MTKKLWFQFGVGILLVILIVKYFMEISWIFGPLIILAKAIFFPLLLGGVLFYISVPIQQFLENRKVPRWGSILTILACLGVVIWIFISIIGPPVGGQVTKLIDSTPKIASDINKLKDTVLERKDELPPRIVESIDSATDSLESIAVGFGKWVVQFIQTLFQTMFLLVLVPFFFIFMLKDHEKLAPFICSFFQGEKQKWVKQTLRDIDSVLRAYIQGQLLISTILAILIFIGYSILGLEYALLLAIFALFMNLIPFIGPWVAVIPAIMIAFLQEPKLVIGVAIVTLIAQQTDSNFITPNIMGKTLEIHPLTVITIILAAGNIAGFLGILLAIPVYAVGKAILKNIYAARKGIKQTATKSI